MRGSALRGGVGGLQFDRDSGGEVGGRKHAGEHLILPLQLAKFRVGEESAIAVAKTDLEALSVGIREENELLRISNGKIAEQHRIDDREDRGVGADAKGEGEDGYSREARGFAQHADGIAQIFNEGVDDVFPSVFADKLLQTVFQRSMPSTRLPPWNAGRFQL